MKTTGIVFGVLLSGLCVGSTNAQWYQQVSGVTMDLRAVSFADSLHGIAGGMGGSSGDTLLRTTDGGTTWQIVRTGYPASIFGAEMKTALIGWVTGYVTLKTTDGGLSWVQQYAGSGQGISFSDLQHGLIVGLGGYVWRTTNGGSTWVQESSGGSPLTCSTSAWWT